MRICSACATTTDEAGRFCPECGAVLVDRAPVDAAAATSLLPAGDDSSLAETARKSLVGKTIDGFAFESILGGGAFGTVYRGRQLGLDRPVAIKVPTHEIAADPVMARRFEREARSAAKITHPGVVGIYAVGTLDDGRPYLAMQLIDGDPLDHILETGPVPARRTLGIARLIASALSETHAAGVVHRDLKPSNIIWRRDRNGDDRITLVDFGIAIAKPGNADATRLTTNGVIGTPHYMSPEQAQGENVDHRADLYALGCIMFELLTGETPFDGSGFEVLLAHIGRPLPIPSDRNPDVPPVVDELVLRLMAKRADDRPRTADEVVELIDEALEKLDTPARTAGATVRAPRAKRKSVVPTMLHEHPAPPPSAPARRRGRWIALALVGVVGLTGGGLAALHFSRGSSAALASSGGPTADDDTDSDPAAPSVFTGRRTVVTDDGEMSSRVTLYDPIVAGTRTRTSLEIWNAIGAPLDVDHVVVTIEDPKGGVSGLTATPSKKTKGKYAFKHVFPEPGHYVMRVFPPEVATVFLIEVDVGSR